MSVSLARGTLPWIAHHKRNAAEALYFLIIECRRFYPWPALIESWQRDLKALGAPVPPPER
jgi:hypothetical protein